MNNGLISSDHYQLETYAKWTCAFVITVGVLALLCWVFSLWMPDFIKDNLLLIRVNTAFCFILSGVSLWLHIERKNSLTYNIAIISAAMVFLIASVTLLEHFFQIDLGIDKSFIGTQQYILPNIPLGRMSPSTATNFVLIGCSLLFMNSKIIRPIIQQIFISIVIILTFLQLLGYIYKLGSHEFIFGISANYSQLPLLSIISFLVLASGILCVRSGSGILAILTSKHYGGVIARRLIPPAILLPIVVGYLVSLGGSIVGFNEAELGVSILVTTTIIIFAAIVAVNAYVVDRADIKRQQVEHELKLNQLKLKAVLDNTSALIYIQDTNGRFLLVNKQFEKVVHKGSEEIINELSRQVLSKDHDEKNQEIARKVVRSRAPVVIEENYPYDEEMHSYISNYFPLFTEHNCIYAIGCIATDVTTLNRVNAELKENQERLVLALKSADAGVWSWDIPTDTVIWDEHMFKLFGLKLGAFTGSYNAVLNLIHPDDRNYFHDQVTKSLDYGNELKIEFRILFSDGSVHYLADRGKLFYDEFGHPLRMTGVCWDMTEAKRNEIELQKAKEIAEELAEKAEEASRVKSAFLAAMSHEIRTPLNGVIGMTGLLRDTQLTQEQREYIETVRVSGELLLSVINDILDFSKLGSGQMKIEKMDFNIYNLIDESIELIAPQIHNKGIAIGSYIEPEVPEWLVGDGGRIRQVLGNLLNNAAKFTEHGEISLKVKILKKENNSILLRFEVLDTGIGINEETKESIFEPFTQGDISTSRKYGGTGLGLAISKRLVELMGGTLGVESIPERGSRFWFTLELTEAGEHADKVVYEIVPELVGKRIICVDDNSINRENIKRQLDTWKLQCDVAIDAAEGLSMMRKAHMNNEPYDLALVDYLMPGMDGFEMVQIMRELPGLGNIPVIILMALGAMFDAKEFEQLNIPLVVTKPIRQIKLLEAITIVLAGGSKLAGAADASMSEISKDDLSENKQYKILLAEDNVINQQVALRILRKLGFNPEVVANGVAAVKAVTSHHYDIVFMDCQMPEMDGYTATKTIREYEKNNQSKYHVPIIAMTAYALKGDKEKCVEAGMDDYISKPFHIKTLTQAIGKYLVKTKFPAAAANKITNEHLDTDVLIDKERLNEIFGSDIEAIKSFLHEFIVASNKLVVSIKSALEKNDVKQLKELFHQLKGSAGNSGVIQVHILSKQAEEKLLTNELNAVRSLLSLIENSILHLENSINKNKDWV